MTEDIDEISIIKEKPQLEDDWEVPEDSQRSLPPEQSFKKTKEKVEYENWVSADQGKLINESIRMNL